MAKRSGKKRRAEPVAARDWGVVLRGVGIPLLLAVVAFCVYLPSLGSGFVYDAHREILQESFLTNLANLPDVLTMKVLGMHLILADRPVTLLYLMLIAAVSGVDPWGYHFASNLLHAANVALFYMLLRRLIAPMTWRMELAGIVAALFFALHPIGTEAVAEVSYCSALLSTFFTLLVLLAATWFRAEDRRASLIAASIGTVCAFLAVASKESGVTAVLALVAYWLLFRRDEAKRPWLLFIGAVLAVTVAFLAARFLLEVKDGGAKLDYVGGSFTAMLLTQPRLWVCMMGKIIWPTGLSADYPLADLHVPSTAFSMVILVVVVALQFVLAYRSRVGAFGVALYWLALAAVSNLIPLHRIVADRYYYLPLAGVALQLFALLLLVKETRRHAFALGICAAALVPLTILSLNRQTVFADDASLWADTLRVSPHSKSARLGLGYAAYQAGRADDAVEQFRQGLALEPLAPELHYNLGLALEQAGRADEAAAEYQRAVELEPTYADARYNLGNLLFKREKYDEAIAQYRQALQLRPRDFFALNNLGNALMESGRVDEAIASFKRAVEVNPNFADAHDDLGLAYAKQGRMDLAAEEFEQAVRLDPSDTSARNNLARAQALLRK